MSKQEMLPSDFEAPPYDKSQPPPAYGDPPQGAYYPNQGMPPAAGYPPQQPGYPPQQAGYPPQQTGYAPMHSGHPPVQQGYPAGQPGVTYTQYQYGNVVVQQPITAQGTAGPMPQDHMTAAILATLFCFWPTGLIAIMRASDSRAAVARGDFVSANSLAQSAKSMIKISICIGIVTIIILTVIIGFYFGYVINKINEIHDDFDDFD